MSSPPSPAQTSSSSEPSWPLLALHFSARRGLGPPTASSRPALLRDSAGRGLFLPPETSVQRRRASPRTIRALPVAPSALEAGTVTGGQGQPGACTTTPRVSPPQCQRSSCGVWTSSLHPVHLRISLSLRSKNPQVKPFSSTPSNLGIAASCLVSLPPFCPLISL
uniref:Uncharacterized protein n=1 Tax=Rousettus aegyptiacus TaxID=9407 RepID=A0A7J8BAG6_ROUAE|nr:hypothetical protein HJG63_009999 [Rousettus aegyptiacus]